METKTMGNTTASGATKNVRDIQFWGDGDTFKLISKAWSEEEGWMKSTKAMATHSGVFLQVTTQQRNPDGSYSLAEAVTFAPMVMLFEVYEDGYTCSAIVETDGKDHGKVVKRYLK